jgi:hypothetical protein
MTEIIEINNNTKKLIKVFACRSTSSGMLYVQVGDRDGYEITVAPMFYAQIEVREVST